MFDLGSWGEFLIIIVAAVVLVRPEDMPRFLGALGRTFRKFQDYTAQIRHQVDRMTHQVDLEDFQKEAHKRFEDEIEENLQAIQNSKKKDPVKKKTKKPDPVQKKEGEDG